MEAVIQGSTVICPVEAAADVSNARRRVKALSSRSGFVDRAVARIDLVVTELATNLINHAKGKRVILARLIVERTHRSVEIVAMDEGPGMDRRISATADRVSVSKGGPDPNAPRSSGLGVGLASIARLADEFDIYSRPGHQTVVLARFHTRPPGDMGSLRVGGVMIPAPGNEVSGDDWAIARSGSILTLAMLDGLGHGEKAHAASSRAIELFRTEFAGDISGFMTDAHAALRSTRGAATTIASIDPRLARVRVGGIGNILGRIYLEHDHDAITSRDGILGLTYRMPSIQVRSYRWAPGATLILHTDGIRSQWALSDHQGLLTHDPTIIAAALMAANLRGNDDATIAVVQDRRPMAGAEGTGDRSAAPRANDGPRGTPPGSGKVVEETP